MGLTKQEWEAMFDEIDKSKDGSLSVEELDVGLKARNIHVSKMALKVSDLTWINTISIHK
uniref:EF-hand domain-containing protein n=1 Tax=Octopus bimaculoides TaxID=37653 RepID=A0A0L8FHZ7_OCTBM